MIRMFEKFKKMILLKYRVVLSGALIADYIL